MGARTILVVCGLLVAAGCRPLPAPGGPGGQVEVLRCLEARLADAGGVKTYELMLPDGLRMAYVTGPGAPHLALRESAGVDRFELCGNFHQRRFEGVACGTVPVFVAESFRPLSPAGGFREADVLVPAGWGRRLRCDQRGYCRIASFHWDYGVISRFVAGLTPRR